VECEDFAGARLWIAAVREARQNRDIRDSLTSEYAIADNAIQTEFSQ